MGHIPDCPPEPPTLGCTGERECLEYSWKTGRDWKTCGGPLQCQEKWDPGS